MTDPADEPNSTINTLEIKQSTAMAGLHWIGMSFSLFGKNPSIWIVMLVIYFGISFLLTSIPILVLLPILLTPAFNAGFMYGAKQVDSGNMLEIDHLFAGFKQRLRSLFRLGMLYFMANLIIIVVASVLIESLADKDSIAAMSQATTTLELEQILAKHPGLLVALLETLMIVFVLSIPLVMASWFAPVLVMFHQVTPAKAMLLSIKACNKNILPFLVYSILMIPIMLLALVPLGLGLLIIIPVIFISQYCSYKAIFSQQQTYQGVFLV
ncbi:MAG: hypothetical protein GY829_06430 [Gammaproteobacteria bacterium]|nr:hypothetical protein [Gammaproteobacteria bacterium]